MKQPNLGYSDVKLDFACMHPAGSARRVSLCDYYDLCGCTRLIPLKDALSTELQHRGRFNQIKISGCKARPGNRCDRPSVLLNSFQCKERHLPNTQPLII